MRDEMAVAYSMSRKINTYFYAALCRETKRNHGVGQKFYAGELTAYDEVQFLSRRCRFVFIA